ncbi:MAG: hypothetical protein KDA61_22585, partial [Planctomycetales bacterium]|nr:hypothetical protein [Planctomycetales bacterium]
LSSYHMDSGGYFRIDDSKIGGTISLADIEDWRVNYTAGNTSFSLTPTNSDLQIFTTHAGIISALPSGLFIDPSLTETITDFIVADDSGGNPKVTWRSRPGVEFKLGLQGNSTSTLRTTVPSPTQIALAPVAVPEANALLIWSGLTAAAAVFGMKRGQKTRSAQGE